MSPKMLKIIDIWTLILSMSLFKEIVEKAAPSSPCQPLTITSLSMDWCLLVLTLREAAGPGGHTVCPAEEAGAGAHAGGPADVTTTAIFCAEAR